MPSCVRSSLILPLLALLATGCAEPPCDDGQRRVSVRRDNATLSLDEVCADVARTEEERSLGLQGRPSLPTGEGLLMELPVESELCITNRNVPFPIDVVFAEEDGRVAAIVRGMAALDEQVQCRGPARRVLELPAGEAERVRPGDAMVVAP